MDRFKAGIDGQYDEKKNKYEYETEEYGSLYLNSLPTFISNKFTAQVKKESYGRALIFDVEKLERFENLYSNSQLKEDNVKIKVKLVSPKAKNEDYDDFLGAYTNISEKKSDNKSNNQGETEEHFDEGIGAKTTETIEISKQKNNEIDIGALQKSSESSQSSLINNEEEKNEI